MQLIADGSVCFQRAVSLVQRIIDTAVRDSILMMAEGDLKIPNDVGTPCKSFDLMFEQQDIMLCIVTSDFKLFSI